MLRLNDNDALASRDWDYSNTTNVKVKWIKFTKCSFIHPNSNTTNVKVKYALHGSALTFFTHSNTTNVKVKLLSLITNTLFKEIFKYNQC